MKTGRPRLGDAEKKAQITGVRLTGDERSLLERVAAQRSKKLSAWIRDVLLRAANRQARGNTD
jgi:uncharacterized protein (DUF1778 family)